MNETEFESFANNFAIKELESLEKQRLGIIIPLGHNTYKIRDWTLKIESPGRVVCGHRKYDPVVFFSKACATLYILAALKNEYRMQSELTNLDEQISRYKNEYDRLVESGRACIKSKNHDRFDLVFNKLTEANSRLVRSLNIVKKYGFLTKYKKGF